MLMKIFLCDGLCVMFSCFAVNDVIVYEFYWSSVSPFLIWHLFDGKLAVDIYVASKLKNKTANSQTAVFVCSFELFFHSNWTRICFTLMLC